MKNKIVQFFLTLLMAISLLTIGVWFLYALSQAGAGFQSGILALIGVVTAGIIAHRSAKSREIEARHFDDKRSGYNAFVDVMMQQFQEVKAGKKNQQKIKEMQKKIIEYKKMLLIWADSDVIKMWNNFEKGGMAENDSVDILLKVDELLRAMRKDLGKDDSQLEEGELVSLILIPEEKHKVRKQGK